MTTLAVAIYNGAGDSFINDTFNEATVNADDSFINDTFNEATVNEQNNDDTVLSDKESTRENAKNNLPTLTAILLSYCNDVKQTEQITVEVISNRATYIAKNLLVQYAKYGTEVIDENEAEALKVTIFSTFWAHGWKMINLQSFQEDDDNDLGTSQDIVTHESDTHVNDNVSKRKERPIDNNYNESHESLVISKIKTNILELLLTSQNVHNVNQQMMNYYSFDMVTSGKKYLIVNMMNRFDATADETFATISDEEVECQIQISEFVSTLTRNQLMEFSSVVNSINKCYHQSKIPTLCTLPISLADIRRNYIDGVDSITKHLPIPDIRILKNHSYVSIRDYVADFLLSNKNKLKMLDDYKSLMQTNNDNKLNLFSCNRIKYIIETADVKRGNVRDPIIVLFFKLWSDDFYPNNSIKSNRQSVWV